MGHARVVLLKLIPLKNKQTKAIRACQAVQEANVHQQLKLAWKINATVIISCGFSRRYLVVRGAEQLIVVGQPGVALRVPLGHLLPLLLQLLPEVNITLTTTEI